jgi:hypothetical protein
VCKWYDLETQARLPSGVGFSQVLIASRMDLVCSFFFFSFEIGIVVFRTGSMKDITLDDSRECHCVREYVGRGE